MSKKRFKLQAACPQCGCSFATHLSKEELLARYGDVPNIELTCGECTLTYSKPREEVCPEWDKECKIGRAE